MRHFIVIGRRALKTASRASFNALFGDGGVVVRPPIRSIAHLHLPRFFPGLEVIAKHTDTHTHSHNELVAASSAVDVAVHAVLINCPTIVGGIRNAAWETVPTVTETSHFLFTAFQFSHLSIDFTFESELRIQLVINKAIDTRPRPQWKTRPGL